LVRVGQYEIDLLPSTMWGKSLAQLSRTKCSGFRSTWDTIRKRELERASHKCELCGAAESLLCHEKWRYETETQTQRLVGYEIACRSCNLILHPGRSGADGLIDQTISHFCNVTGLTKKELDKAIVEAYSDWAERSKHDWHIDVTYDELAKPYEGQVNELSWQKTTSIVV
jgi:hypothetical protein